MNTIENCPICGKHCLLSNPGCNRGAKFADTVNNGESAEIDAIKNQHVHLHRGKHGRGHHRRTHQ